MSFLVVSTFIAAVAAQAGLVFVAADIMTGSQEDAGRMIPVPVRA